MVEACGLGFDRDPLFPFQIHGIKHLLPKFTRGKGSGSFNQPIRKGGFAMVDMRDNRKIPDVFHLDHLV